MPSLQIRSLPDDLYQALSYRAERAHRSLAQQALIELRQVVELDAGGSRRRAALARIRADLSRGIVPSDLPPPERLIREDRER